MFQVRLTFDEPRISDEEAIQLINERFPSHFRDNELLLPIRRNLQSLDLAAGKVFKFSAIEAKLKKKISTQRRLSHGEEFRKFHSVATSLYRKNCSILKDIYSMKLQEAEDRLIRFLERNLMEHHEKFQEECLQIRSPPIENLRERLLRHFKLFRILSPVIQLNIIQIQSLALYLGSTTFFLYRKFHSDPELLLECVRSLCLTDYIRRTIFLFCRPTRFILRCCSDLGFDFWGYRCGTAKSSDQFSHLMNSFARGFYRNLPKLAQFGFTLRFTKSHHEELCEQLREIRAERGTSLCRIIRGRKLRKLKKQWTNKRITMAIQRLLISDICIGGWAHREEPLLLLSKLSPEPHLAPFELNKYLKPYLRPFFWESLQEKAMEYRYRNAFPDNYEDYTPRSLLHLSRLVVRQRMADNLQIPYGVKKLPVPKPVKRYLLNK